MPCYKEKPDVKPTPGSSLSEAYPDVIVSQVYLTNIYCILIIQILFLRTCCNYCLTGFIALVLSKVLDESVSKI